MSEATMTPAQSGNDSASASYSTDINDPANLNFEDESDEEQTTVPEQSAEVEGEPDESEETAQDSEESESDETSDEETTEEDEGEEPEATEVNLPDEALVTLSNGEKVPLKELKKGYFREADYTRGKQELGNQFKAVAEKANRIENITQKFVNFLAEQMPQAPDPSLVFSDPTKYAQDKAIYDIALARVQTLIETQDEAAAVGQQLSVEQRRQAEERARSYLLQAMPHLQDDQKRAEFGKAGWEAVMQVGFTPEEATANLDPRLNILAYWAAKGMKAEQAEKKVQAKVQAAPKVTPAKTAQPKGNPQFLRNKEAMRRLAKTGSIQDAMSIDFD